MDVTDLVGSGKEPFVTADRGPVRFIVINRPEARNALTRQMRRDFPDLLAAAQTDPAVAAVVVTGMDPAFCSGVDLKELSQGRAPPIVPNPAEALRAFQKPVIAAVNGPCTTGALEVALSCSFVIASPQARFADAHAKVGLFPRWGQCQLLAQAVGMHRARQLLLTGEFIDADQGLRWGIVNELVAAERLLDRCLELGLAIAAANPDCVRLLGAALSVTPEAVPESERHALSEFDRLRATPSG